MGTVTEKFKAIAVSSNTNSFGLRGVVIVNRKGKAFQIGVTSQFAPKKGEEVDIVFPVEEVGALAYVAEYPITCNGVTIELPKKLPKCPPEVLKEIFPDL